MIMSQASAATDSGVHGARDDAHALERIRDALRGLRFGTVSVIVQDGVVVQVERTEKLRLLRRERER
jgi:hypothetical protein